jgi:hypothetical protein
MVKTLNRFNTDPHFEHPFPTTESHLGDNSWRFEIGVDYKPSMSRVVPQ